MAHVQTNLCLPVTSKWFSESLMESDVVRWQQNQVQGSCTMKSSVFVNSARTRKMSDGWVQKRTIKPTKDWVKMKHIDIMEWPTQSPHLSPIWNWGRSKSSTKWQPRKLQDLENFCKEEWANIPPEMCTNWGHSGSVKHAAYWPLEKSEVMAALFLRSRNVWKHF